MIRLVKILKSFSLLKGKFFTLIGIGLIVLGGYIMYDTRSITTESIELVVIGLILSGVTDETISHIRSKSGTNPEP